MPIKAALARLFQSPSLHTIVPHMCSHTFIHVLGLATGLKHLNLYGYHDRSCHRPTVISPMIPPLPSAASHDIYLESLEMTLEPKADALVGYLSRPDCPLKISRLRELRIHSNYRLPTAAATVMKSASQSLESLIWILSESSGAYESPGEDWFESMFESPGIDPELHPSIGLQDFVSLRHLTLSTRYSGEGMIDVLESGLGVLPKLEELNIHYEYWEDEDEYLGTDCDDVEKAFVQQLEWDDEAFGSMYTSGRFPCLKRINIMLVSQLLIDGDALEVWLQDCLPFFRRAGVLVVKVGGFDDGKQFMEDVSIVSCG